MAEQNLASEKVVGEISLSILNLVRRTRGVVSARTGCTREWRRVGTTSVGGQRYDGRWRKMERVRLGPRVVEAMMDLEELVSLLQQRA